MGQSYGPPVVDDGLIFSLDAANQLCYPGSDTTIYDLSGNEYSGTINLATFESNPPSFNFPANNANYISSDFTAQSTDFTISIWFKDDGVRRTYERLVDKVYSTGFYLARNNNNVNSWGGGIQEGSSPYGIFITLEDGVWHNLVSLRSGTNHVIYGDGITNTNSNTVSDAPLSAATLAIGNWNTLNNSQSFGGNIAVVKYYNRALSESEILQNYNALKGRFGR